MFAAHVRQRHPEVCPTTSNDDDSGRHSGLESPDISRNPKLVAHTLHFHQLSVSRFHNFFLSVFGAALHPTFSI